MRFVIAAQALEEYYIDETQSPTDFCFDLLSSLQYNHTKQWSVTYDLKDFRISFRTAGHSGIKFLNFSDLDFSTEADFKILPSIDLDQTGDIFDNLVDYSIEADQRVIETFMTELIEFFIANNQLTCDPDGYLLKWYDFDLQYLIDRALEISQKTMRLEMDR